ncbi:MAG TPA: TonB-dependent receptor [Allosphingosinicella sp.]|jgi:outer membrane receptor protein involved in Fe transport
MLQRVSGLRPFSVLLFASTMLTGSAAFAQASPQPPSPAASPPGAPPNSGPAAAAAPDTAQSDEQEIVVTATKRAENLQNVPLSIQALGTQRLEEANVSNFNDYTKLTPSVSFQTTAPGVTNVYIRGVASGGDGNHSGSLPSVGVYLDEQPITTIGGTLDVHIYDIARIEVLRGPQGTLYGASSEAGTIRIITNKPDKSSFYGGIDTELNDVDHGGVGGKVEGYVNAPIGGSAALRIVGWYERDAGYIDNVPGTRSFLPQPGGIVINNAGFVKNNYNDVEVAGGRAALGIDLTDNWTATATIMGQDQKSHGAFGFDPRTGDLQVQHFLPEYDHDRFAQAALTIQGKIGNWDLTYAGAYLERKINSASDYTDYAEAYDNLYASAGGLAGYFYYKDNAGNEIVPSQWIVGRDHFTKDSQELRITSPADSRLRFVGGLFYQRQTHLIHQDYEVAGLAANLSVNGFPGTLWLTQQDRVDRDYAAFGEASFDILSNLTLTGGLRGYKYDNSLIGFFGFGRDPNGPPFNAAGSSRTGVAGCYTTTGQSLRDNPGGTLLPAAVPGSPCTDLATFVDGHLVPKSTKGSGLTHRLNLTWKVTPDKMLYATWSSGFRPGGINRRGTLAPYQEDKLFNYEIGFKTSWPGHLVLNGAFFLQDWKKFQFSFLGQNSFTEIHNGPDARIKGAELDIDWRPVHGFSLIASGAYTDAKTKHNLCGFDDPTFACTQPGPGGETNYVSAPAGTRLPVTPRFKVAGTARYEFPVTSGGTNGHVQAVLTHQSSAASDIRTLIFAPGTGAAENPAALTGRLPAYTMVDFAIGLDWHRFTAELFVENAFDERAEITRFQECGQCFQRPYAVIYRPRTVGVRLGTKF